MKKMFFAVLALATMVSCSKENGSTEPFGEAPVPVYMTGGIGNVVIGSKAVINPDDAFDAQFVASETSGDYSTVLWNPEAAVAAGTGVITLDPLQYYPINGSTIYMRGFAPQATVAGGKVAYTVDGSNDIMLTEELSGSKATTTPLGFTFQHLLTQLKFKVMAADASFPSDITVTEIKVTNTQTAASLTLDDGSLVFSGGAKELTVFTGGSYPISTTAANISELVMVEPGTTQILLDVAVNENGISRSYPGVVVALATVQGNSHLITLTFKTSEVTAKATVAPWTNGAEGGAELN